MKTNNLFVKIGFILIIIGFFTPISCNLSGIEITQKMFDLNKVFYAVLFLAIIATAVIGLLLSFKEMNKGMFLLLTAVNGACGIILFIKLFQKINLQIGGYLILAGWIVEVLTFLLYSKLTKKLI
ncbi:hypothetical protein ACFL6D_01805 [Spirochaetota bacterium]